jgi:hypothetical protein
MRYPSTLITDRGKGKKGSSFPLGEGMCPESERRASTKNLQYH